MITSESKVLIAFIISAFGVLFTLVIKMPTEHEKRIELIEEKKLLLELKQDVNHKIFMEDTQKFIDSMEVKINNDLNNK